VINGFLFWFVASFMEGFEVGGFWSAFLGALAFSIISSLLSMLLPGD
jgi:putative membrane protein